MDENSKEATPSDKEKIEKDKEIIDAILDVIVENGEGG